MACASSDQMSSSLDRCEESRIECPVCSDIFQLPKVFTCGHSVCNDCCQKLLKKGNTIACPVCRRPTAVPVDGLPTNFALQDLIQLYKGTKDQKRYRCIDCDQFYSANETYLSTTNLDNNQDEICPLCFHCFIAKRMVITASTQPKTAVESVADTFKRYEDDLSKLKERTKLISDQELQWTSQFRVAGWMIRNRAQEIIQASQSLTDAAEEDLKAFQYLDGWLKNVTVPQSLDRLTKFGQLIRETTMKLDQLEETKEKQADSIAAFQNVLENAHDILIGIVSDSQAMSVGTEAEEESIERAIIEGTVASSKDALSDVKTMEECGQSNDGPVAEASDRIYVS